VAHEITITRKIAASPDEVYDAWTDPKSVMELRPIGREETQLTLTHKHLPTEKAAEEHRGGWTAILDQLAATLPKARKRQHY
jgi:uncharacterized protein YndB with AHSA1/START domain